MVEEVSICLFVCESFLFFLTGRVGESDRSTRGLGILHGRYENNLHICIYRMGEMTS